MAIAISLANSVGRPFTPLKSATGEFFGVQPPPFAQGQQPSRIWRVKQEEAFALGVSNPRGFPRTWAAIPPGADPVACIRNSVELEPQGQSWLIEPMNIPPGRYFRRIARPYHQHPGDFPVSFGGGTDSAYERAAANLQIDMLTERLRDCFRVVSPVKGHLDTYGPEFRNILIIAATEVEAQWKGILRANNYKPPSGRPQLSTRDYFRLEAVLRLADYCVTFPHYPWMEDCQPFLGWTACSPSQSIPWYDAYNAVKHDREQNEGRATLFAALSAVAAVVVVATAQFGVQFLRDASRWHDIFEIKRYPSWSIGDTHGDMHVDGYEHLGRVAIDYPFL